MASPSTLIENWCKDNHEQSFRAFYRQQATKLWRFLIARGAPTETAYDLMAEAFTRFIQVACKDTSAPVALLYRIAINLQIDTWRHDRASPVIPNSHEVAHTGSASVPDEHAAVRELVAALPNDEQNLLLMRYWIGLTYKEIANIQNIPEGTLRRRGAALLKTLAERLDSER